VLSGGLFIDVLHKYIIFSQMAAIVKKFSIIKNSKIKALSMSEVTLISPVFVHT